MKTSLLFTAILILTILAGCRKDEKPDYIIAEVQEDIPNNAFVNTSIVFNLNEFDQTKGGGYGEFTEYNVRFTYSLQIPIKDEGRLLYPIKREWNVYQYVKELEDWSFVDSISYESLSGANENLERYYRYDDFEKKAFVYNGIDDATPQLIMDFNFDWGDEILIDAEYGLYFAINERKTFNNNGIEYPYYIGRFVFKNENYEWQYSYYTHLTTIHPFNPNPYYMVENFKDIENLNLSELGHELALAEDSWIHSDIYGNFYSMSIKVNLDSTINLLNLDASYSIND